jgi:hypothetical protein
MIDQNALAGICPICGEQNRCEMADKACMESSQTAVQSSACQSTENQSTGKQGIENQATGNPSMPGQNTFACWCKSMQLTPSIRKTLARQASDKRCICERCLKQMLQEQ